MARSPQYEFAGVFGSMDFPLYKYQEFPKHIKDEQGNLIGVANNGAQELELLQSYATQATQEAKKTSTEKERDEALIREESLRKENEEMRKKLEELAGVKAEAAPPPVATKPQTKAG